MKRTRHTAKQIIRKLKTAEQLIAQDKTIADVCRVLELANIHLTESDENRRPARRMAGRDPRQCRIEDVLLEAGQVSCGQD